MHFGLFPCLVSYPKQRALRRTRRPARARVYALRGQYPMLTTVAASPCPKQRPRGGRGGELVRASVDRGGAQSLCRQVPAAPQGELLECDRSLVACVCGLLRVSWPVDSGRRSARVFAGTFLLHHKASVA